MKNCFFKKCHLSTFATTCFNLSRNVKKQDKHKVNNTKTYLDTNCIAHKHVSGAVPYQYYQYCGILTRSASTPNLSTIFSFSVNEVVLCSVILHFAVNLSG